jgi:hypothetical protein
LFTEKPLLLANIDWNKRRQLRGSRATLKAKRNSAVSTMHVI